MTKSYKMPLNVIAIDTINGNCEAHMKKLMQEALYCTAAAAAAETSGEIGTAQTEVLRAKILDKCRCTTPRGRSPCTALEYLGRGGSDVTFQQMVSRVEQTACCAVNSLVSPSCWRIPLSKCKCRSVYEL